MEIEGKVIQELEPQSGVSKAGKPWKKREIIIETFGTYPRKVKITLFGERADSIPAVIGESYSFSIDVESREWQGRWYTDVSAYAARPLGMDPNGNPPYPGYPQQQPQYGAPQPQYGAPQQQQYASQNSIAAPAAPAASPADPFGASSEPDDLPF